MTVESVTYQPGVERTVEFFLGLQILFCGHPTGKGFVAGVVGEDGRVRESGRSGLIR